MVHETVVNDTEDYETVEYETVVCDEMPMFPVKMVSLLQPSNSDLVTRASCCGCGGPAVCPG